MTNKRVVDERIEATEVIVDEVSLAEFESIRLEFTKQVQLFIRAKVYCGIVAFAFRLLTRNRAKVRQRFVVVNRADVVAPTIGKFGLALGKEKRMPRGAYGNASKQTHHRSVDERSQTLASKAGA